MPDEDLEWAARLAVECRRRVKKKLEEWYGGGSVERHDPTGKPWAFGSFRE